MTIIRKPVIQNLKPHPSHKYAMACYIIDQAEKAIRAEREKCALIMKEAIEEARNARADSETPVVPET